jgi:periplasmic copper chaperone A
METDRKNPNRRRMMMRNLFNYFVILCTLTACTVTAAAGPNIHVESAWARPAVPMGSMTSQEDTSAMGGMSATPTMDMPGMSGSQTGSAAYFVIVNDSDQVDTLVGVSTAAASRSSLNETQIKENIARMVPVSSLDIPARGKVEFKPGGYHVMLEGVQQNLKEGDTFKLTLQFKKSGSITVDISVRQQQ